MGGFERWVAEGRPPTLVTTCGTHRLPEDVMAGGYLSQAGQETWPYPVCVLCGLEDPHDMAVELWAVHDGSEWQTADALGDFKRLWLATMSRRRMLPLLGYSPDLVPDPAAPVAGPTGWPLVWAFQVLNPGLGEAEARYLYEATSTYRREGRGHDHLAKFPYTDLASLRAISAGSGRRWQDYHQALWDDLSPSDQALADVTDWEVLFSNSRFVPRGDRRSGDSELVREFMGPCAGYVERVLAAHRRVLKLPGAEPPSSNDRVTWVGDEYGDLGFDVAYGLYRWRHPRR